MVWLVCVCARRKRASCAVKTTSPRELLRRGFCGGFGLKIGWAKSGVGDDGTRGSRMKYARTVRAESALAPRVCFQLLYHIITVRTRALAHQSRSRVTTDTHTHSHTRRRDHLLTSVLARFAAASAAAAAAHFPAPPPRPHARYCLTGARRALCAV